MWHGLTPRSYFSYDRHKISPFEHKLNHLNSFEGYLIGMLSSTSPCECQWYLWQFSQVRRNNYDKQCNIGQINLWLGSLDWHAVIVTSLLFSISSWCRDKIVSLYVQDNIWFPWCIIICKIFIYLIFFWLVWKKISKFKSPGVQRFLALFQFLYYFVLLLLS